MVKKLVEYWVFVGVDKSVRRSAGRVVGIMARMAAAVAVDEGRDEFGMGNEREPSLRDDGASDGGAAVRQSEQDLKEQIVADHGCRTAFGCFPRFAYSHSTI